MQSVLDAEGYVSRSQKYVGFDYKVKNHIARFAGSNNLVKNLGKEVDGTKLKDKWFPVDEIRDNFDIFISHSHMDLASQNTISLFASWLYDNYGLRCFIDSYYWKYADELTRMLLDAYGNPHKVGKSTSYSYKSAKFLISVVDILLANALEEMISNVDMVLFVDSDNSLVYHKGANGSISDKTPSPWIYHEINFINNTKGEAPAYYNRWLKNKGKTSKLKLFSEGAKFLFKVDTDKFFSLSYDDFLSLNGEGRDALCDFFDMYDENELNSNLDVYSLND